MTNTKFIIKLAAILFAIAFLCSLILVVCNSITEPVIKKLQIESENSAKAEVLSINDGEFKNIKADGVDEAYLGYDKDGNLVGYCFKVSPSGFGGKITLMVGVDTSCKVVGVKITQMSETPGLGAKASEPDWLNKFVGKTNGINIAKGGKGGENDVDAISGATITSKAVANGINLSLDAAQKLIEKEGK